MIAQSVRESCSSLHIQIASPRQTIFHSLKTEPQKDVTPETARRRAVQARRGSSKWCSSAAGPRLAARAWTDSSTSTPLRRVVDPPPVAHGA